jgi:imidazolonepropionase-like amidohydrolase
VGGPRPLLGNQRAPTSRHSSPTNPTSASFGPPTTCALLLEAGFTSVREVGGYGVYLSTAIEEGTITGPTVYASGSILSQTGGHGDIHGLSIPHVDELFERHFGAPTLCDGPDDCRRLVRRQLRLGARVIKVCASGGS